MSEIQTKEGSSSSFIRDNKGRVSFKLFSFYYILPIFYLLTAIGLFLFRLNRLKLIPDKEPMFILWLIVIFIINFSFLFYGKTIFTKRQAIKHFSYLNMIIVGLLVISGISFISMLIEGILFQGDGEILFIFFMHPLVAYSSVFFPFYLVCYFTLLCLPKKYFNTSEYQLNLKRNTILFYILFFVLFYFPFIMFILTGSEFLYGETFFK